MIERHNTTLDRYLAGDYVYKTPERESSKSTICLGARVLVDEVSRLFARPRSSI